MPLIRSLETINAAESSATCSEVRACTARLYSTAAPMKASTGTSAMAALLGRCKAGELSTRAAEEGRRDLAVREIRILPDFAARH